MQTIDGRPVYAATDLVAYLACEHLTQLERAALAGLVKRPMRDDPELDIIRKRGYEHERRFLADLLADGRTSTTITLDGSIADQGDQLRAAAAETIAAMGAGDDVIFQATFFDGTWRGHADFLLRIDDPDRPSVWGPWHYEVADTKLARHVKASAVLQICSYVDQLERVQGVRPEWMHVALGGSARAVERLRVDDYMAYYRSAKARFLATMTDEVPATYPPATTYPEPVEHCDVCRWAAECVARRRSDDHLSLVAGISARQRRALIDRGVPTLEALGDLPLPMEPKLEGTSKEALLRVREQARIQLEGRRDGALHYELLLPQGEEPIGQERGLASLPPPSPGDLFLDLEGDPYAFDDGLDYLFGILEVDGTFHAFWSRDEAGEFSLDGERRAFEAVMDFIGERLRADPNLHIYHYAPYEPTAMKRLMGRYGTRENEVDDLLRAGTLVDLLARGPSVAARVGRELLDQEDGGVLRVHPRGRPSRRGVEHRRVRGVARAGRGRATGLDDPRSHRALQPRRRRSATCSCATGSRRCASNSPRRPAGRSPARANARLCRRTSRRRRRASRPWPIAWRTHRSSRRTPPTATRSSMAAGCSHNSSAGIAARTSPCGGTSSATWDSTRIRRSRRTSRLAGSSRSVRSTSRCVASRHGGTRSRTRTSTSAAATCTTRRWPRPSPGPARSTGTRARWSPSISRV